MHRTEAADQVSDVWLDPDLAKTLLSYLRGAQWQERGGVLLGQREGGSVRVSGAVFPPQLARAGNHCAFDVTCIDIIRQSVTPLDSEIKRIAGTIVGWIHSHPGHGLFLSRTDVETLTTWTQLDDRAVAVVVDPFLRRHQDQQIAWWQRAGKGRLATFENRGADVLTLRKACTVAEAIGDNATGSRKWEVLASGCIIGLIPTASEANPGEEPAPHQRSDLW